MATKQTINLYSLFNMPSSDDSFLRDEDKRLTITRHEDKSYAIWTFDQADESDPDPIYTSYNPSDILNYTLNY